MNLKKNEVALYNTSEASVLAYPIEEAQTDDFGNAIIDRDTQAWKTTGNTYEWSIAASEKKIFPRYVAKYLMGIYGFLEEVDVSGVQIVDEESEENPSDSVSDTPNKEEIKDSLDCKYCDFTAKDVVGLAMHLGHKHPEAVTRL